MRQKFIVSFFRVTIKLLPIKVRFFLKNQKNTSLNGKKEPTIADQVKKDLAGVYNDINGCDNHPKTLNEDTGSTSKQAQYEYNSDCSVFKI